MFHSHRLVERIAPASGAQRQWTDARLIEHLRHVGIRIADIERNRAVAMALQWMDNLDLILERPTVAGLGIRDRPDDKAEMIEGLFFGRSNCSPMERQIIASGTEIGVVRVGLPDDLHPEHAAIELACPIYVGNAQGQMPESAMVDHQPLPSRIP